MKSTIVIITVIIFSFLRGSAQKIDSTYLVQRLKNPMVIDGDWDKAQWRAVKAVELTNYMGTVPPFRPVVHAKMMYDKDNLYVVFRVNDRYVRSIVEEFNGPVSTDACVEFFFSPDPALPEAYFNLEINAGGIPLMGFHNLKQRENQFSADDLKKIEIAHSLPSKIDPEISTPVTWTIEYKLPLLILQKYCTITPPGPGVTWRANFYKTASKSSNPHYITWSVVKIQPQIFTCLNFSGNLDLANSGRDVEDRPDHSIYLFYSIATPFRAWQLTITIAALAERNLN